MARRGPRQLAQAASHRDQDMGAAARRARRRGVVVDRDPGRGQAQARVGRGAGRRVHGPGVASGRGPGRFRRGRRALQGRAPAHAPLRSGLPVLEHRSGPAHARRERGVHVPGAAGPVRMARRRARTHRVRQRRWRGTQDRRGAASAGPACSRRSRRTTGSRAPCARRTPDTRRARSRRRSAWSGASCSCPNRACETWRTSTPDCRTGAWSSAGSPTTPRTRRRPSCSRRTAGPCFPCPGNVSTWSRGSA